MWHVRAQARNVTLRVELPPMDGVGGPCALVIVRLDALTYAGAPLSSALIYTRDLLFRWSRTVLWPRRSNASLCGQNGNIGTPNKHVSGPELSCASESDDEPGTREKTQRAQGECLQHAGRVAHHACTWCR